MFKENIKETHIRSFKKKHESRDEECKTIIGVHLAKKGTTCLSILVNVSSNTVNHTQWAVKLQWVLDFKKTSSFSDIFDHDYNNKGYDLEILCPVLQVITRDFFNIYEMHSKKN